MHAYYLGPTVCSDTRYCSPSFYHELYTPVWTPPLHRKYRWSSPIRHNWTYGFDFETNLFPYQLPLTLLLSFPVYIPLSRALVTLYPFPERNDTRTRIKWMNIYNGNCTTCHFSRNRRLDKQWFHCPWRKFLRSYDLVRRPWKQWCHGSVACYVILVLIDFVDQIFLGDESVM